MTDRNIQQFHVTPSQILLFKYSRNLKLPGFRMVGQTPQAQYAKSVMPPSVAVRGIFNQVP
jgi:hypothetical protein